MGLLMSRRAYSAMTLSLLAQSMMPREGLSFYLSRNLDIKISRLIHNRYRAAKSGCITSSALADRGLGCC